MNVVNVKLNVLGKGVSQNESNKCKSGGEEGRGGPNFGHFVIT